MWLSDTKTGIRCFFLSSPFSYICSAELNLAHTERCVWERRLTNDIRLFYIMIVICSGNPSCDMLMMRDKSFGKHTVTYIHVLLGYFVLMWCFNIRTYLVSLLIRIMTMLSMIYLFVCMLCKLQKSLFYFTQNKIHETSHCVPLCNCFTSTLCGFVCH